MSCTKDTTFGQPAYLVWLKCDAIVSGRGWRQQRSTEQQYRTTRQLQGGTTKRAGQQNSGR
jgi:hypothetical protein